LFNWVKLSLSVFWIRFGYRVAKLYPGWFSVRSPSTTSTASRERVQGNPSPSILALASSSLVLGLMRVALMVTTHLSATRTSYAWRGAKCGRDHLVSKQDFSSSNISRNSSLSLCISPFTCFITWNLSAITLAYGVLGKKWNGLLWIMIIWSKFSVLVFLILL
jgi:hypothetical protein